MKQFLIKITLWLAKRAGLEAHVVLVPSDVLAFARVKVKAVELVGTGVAGLADFKRSHVMQTLQHQFPHAKPHDCANAIQIAVSELRV